MISAAYMVGICQFRDEFMDFEQGLHYEIQPIDAPLVIAAGSHERYEYKFMEGWTVLPTCISREK